MTANNRRSKMDQQTRPSETPTTPVQATALASSSPRYGLSVIVTNADERIYFTNSLSVAHGRAPPPANGPSSLYLNFGDLVAADAAPRTGRSSDDRLAGSVLCCSPSLPSKLTCRRRTWIFSGARRILNFQITNFPIAGPARPGSVSVDYYGLGDLAPSSGTSAALYSR